MRAALRCCSLIVLVALDGSAQVPPPPTDPFEPNNDFTTATPVSLPFLANACIEPQGDIDFFTFSVPSASLSARASSPTGQPFRLDLFDARQTPVATGAGSLQQQLAAGRYFVRVSANATGCYSLQISIAAPPPPPPPGDPFEPNNDFTTATPVSLPFSANACIEPQGDVDFFKFSVPAANLSAAAISVSRQPLRLDLFDAGQNPVVTATGSFQQQLAAGQYFLRASADVTGCYSLQISFMIPPPPPADPFEPNDSFATATPINPNPNSFFSLSDLFTIGDLDFFRFDAGAGTELLLTANSSQVQLFTALFDATGRRLASGSSIHLRLETAGTYFIGATTADDTDFLGARESGSYSLSIFLSAPRILVPGHSFEFLPPFPAFVVAVAPDTGMRYVPTPDLANVVISLAGTSKTVTVPAFTDLQFVGKQFADQNGGRDEPLLGTDTQGHVIALSAEGVPQRVFADTHAGWPAGLAVAEGRLFVSSAFLGGSPAIYAVDGNGSVTTFLAAPALSSTPISLAVSPDGRTLYYTGLFSDDLVQVDIASAAEMGRVHIASSPSIFSRLAVDPATGDVYATVVDLQTLQPLLEGGGSSLPPLAGPLIRYRPATGEVQTFADGIPVLPGNLTFGPCAEGELSHECLFIATPLGVIEIDGFQPPLIKTSFNYAFPGDRRGDSSGDFNDEVTLSAYLRTVPSAAPVPNVRVDFKLGSQGCSGATDSTGQASCTLTLDQHPGDYTVTASFSGDSIFASAPRSRTAFTINQEESQVIYIGQTTSDFHDAFTASAKLVDPRDGNAPIAGKRIDFQLGSSPTDRCSAMTDATGVAGCPIIPTQPAGTYTISASFAGDTDYRPGFGAPATFVVTKEETTTTYTGPTVILQGQPVILMAQLLEDALTPIAGRALTLSLGSQSCMGMTNTDGTAACTLMVTVTLGPQPVGATFATDASYLASADTGKNAIVFAFPDRGAFVLGDTTVAEASPSTIVTWWSDSWSTANSVSGGAAIDSFKGFATALGTGAPVCGASWTTKPGTSPPLPGNVPSYMGTLVASSITKSGSSISGNVVEIVVVRTNPVYAPDPGHLGTGEVVATVCDLVTGTTR